LLGERLVALRIEANKKQSAVAKDLGLIKQYLNYFEKGKRTPDIKTLIKLANYYSVTVDYLVGNSDVKTTAELQLNHLAEQINQETAKLSELKRKVTRIEALLNYLHIELEG